MMHKLWISIILLFIFFDVHSQVFDAKDKAKISEYTPKAHYVDHRAEWLFKNTESKMLKYNPFSLALGGAMFVYQNNISRQFSAQCLYDVSCSEYSKYSLKHYGILKGLSLSADRIMRCNRLARQDIHNHQINTETGKVIDPFILYEKK